MKDFQILTEMRLFRGCLLVEVSRRRKGEVYVFTHAQTKKKHYANDSADRSSEQTRPVLTKQNLLSFAWGILAMKKC